MKKGERKFSYTDVPGVGQTLIVQAVEIAEPVSDDDFYNPYVADMKSSLVGNNELPAFCGDVNGEAIVSQLVDWQVSATRTSAHASRLNDLLAVEVLEGRLDMRILCGVKIARANNLAVSYNAFRAMYGMTMEPALAAMSMISCSEADDIGKAEGALWRKMNKRTNSFVNNTKRSLCQRWNLDPETLAPIVEVPESESSDDSPSDPKGATLPDGSDVTPEDTQEPVTPEVRFLNACTNLKEIFSLITLENGTSIDLVKRWDSAFPKLVANAEELVKQQDAARAARAPADEDII